MSRVRFIDRRNDGEPSYAVEVPDLRAWKTIGRVVRIRPGVWMAEGLHDEYGTRQEAAGALAAKTR